MILIDYALSIARPFSSFPFVGRFAAIDAAMMSACFRILFRRGKSWYPAIENADSDDADVAEIDQAD